MPTVTEKVNDILEKRKEKVPQIREKIESLRETEERICAFERFRNTIIGDDGQLIPNGQFYNVLADKPEMVINIAQLYCGGLKDKIADLITAYEELEKRFSREYVNIAVVGPARQGKSTLLQSITGLDNRCIPAFGGGHCTGASSTIENGNNEEVRVELTYKTRKEVWDEIQGYIDIITRGKETVGALFTYDELKLLKNKGSKEKEDFYERCMTKLNQWNEQYCKDDVDANDAKEMVFKRYVKNYEQWIDLLGRDSETKYDENEIMTYVAQHNGEHEYLDDGSRNPKYIGYFKFVAIKSARIIKAFEYKDCGKIKLVDTVGLGSTENDTEANMISTIKHDSDGVIIFRRPDAAADGSMDATYRNIHKRLSDEFKNRDMQKWFTYIINETSEDSPFRDNRSMCYLKKEDIEKQLPGLLLSINIIDASNVEMVKNDFLIPYLTALSNNINDIDSIIIDEVNESAVKVYDEYKSFFNKAEKVISGKLRNSNSWLKVFRQAFGETYEKNMSGKIKAYMYEWREKKSSPCNILQKQTQDICSSISSRIPTVEEINDIIVNNPTKQASVILTEQLNKLRTDLTALFINIDLSLADLVSDFKDSIVDFMTDDDGGRLKYIVEVNPDKPKSEWLADFSTEALDDEVYTEIKRAIDFLYNFDVSVRGFMMHKVRIQLDIINPLIPEATYVKIEDNLAHSINRQLRLKMKDVKDNLNENLKEFWKVPNEAFYAIADEFFDRITFSECVKDEWESLYSENSGRVWKDKFDAIAYQEIAFTEWRDMVSELGKKAQRTNFVLSIA